MNFIQCDKNRIEEIKQLFAKTFSDSEGEDEGRLIGDLAKELMDSTKDDDLLVFAASEGQKLLACIMLTRLTFEQGNINAFLLAPVAVDTDSQGQGIGQGLINFALGKLREQGVELVCTYGDPKYYNKVGFIPIDEGRIRAPRTLTYPEGWLAQSLLGGELGAIPGCSYCVEAFDKPEYW